ncbi:efflux RND transporter permease subunit [Ochrobactrum soli]|uniref:RND efflux transporter n=1 Tax=Ochrobactrum soli TaxID=2448455 RepID=A0A2P9HEX4_9HYPH|nr:efflux RND transporter permease subunit [[Ochrobactrum] soli]SPL62646.1 RND efflux transporter [[Ochrobactrum] soli]
MIGPNLSQWALSHRPFVAFIMVLAAIAGALTYTRLGRSEDPDFTVKTMVVQTYWPGGTIDETVEQVTDRLEKKLQELPSLDNLRSVTNPGVSTIFVTLKDTTAPARVADEWYQARKKVTDIRATMPSGVEGPFFDDEFGDTFGIIYGLVSDPGFSERELRDWAEVARKRLILIPDVGKIQLIGTQDEKIYIEFSTRHVASLGLDVNAIVSAIQNQNGVTPAGAITSEHDHVIVNVSGAFRDEDDIRNLNIATASGFVRLSDIATVRRGLADPAQPMFRIDGRRALGIAISMAAGGDVLMLGDRIAATMAGFQASLPLGIDVVRVAYQPDVVQTAVSGFTRALFEAVGIVLAVSFVTLGLRAGLVVFVSIPLVLALTFLAMSVAGISLQRVSLGALIIALGLLVDDAMITVEMMVAKLEEGVDRFKAASFAYTSTAFPMLTGTLVTVAGFIPVGYARSAAGEYANSLFWVIAFALLLSWIVAVLVSPIVGILVLPRTLVRSQGRERRIQRAFRVVLEHCLRARITVVAIVAGLFLLSLAGITKVPQQFFPSSDRSELLLDLQMPQRSSIQATAAMVDRLDKLLAADKDIVSWSFYVGQDAIRFYLPMDIQAPADYRAQAVVVARNIEVRQQLRQRLQDVLDRDWPDVTARVAPLEMGPPVGWPVQVRVSGDDIAALRAVAWEVSDAIAAVSGTRDVHLDWGVPTRMLRIQVDQDRARLVGLSSSQLSQAILSITTGVTITQVRDSTYLIDVVGRALPDERADINTLRALQIPLGDGRTVPLPSVATVDYATSEPVVWRRDRRPTITVQADISGRLTAAEVIERAGPAISALAVANPGFDIATGGEVEESGKGLGSVISVVPVMIIAMLIILMTDLQSIQRLFIVVSVAPLGLIGVVAAMLIADKPMGFIAVLGVIALVGMITRNSVILIDQIEQHRAQGEDQWQALIDATVSRARPIMLTAAAAILGMVPIAREAFWAPLAFSVIGGLSVATVLTLIFLPVLYALWFRIRPPMVAADVEGSDPRSESTVGGAGT